MDFFDTLLLTKGATIRLTWIAFGSEEPGDPAPGHISTPSVCLQDDGTLIVDDTELGSALTNDPKAVETFFRGTSSDGFASRLSTQLTSLTDSINGPLVADARGLDNSVDSINDQIDQFEVRIAMRRQILTDQYTKIDTLLRQLPLLQQQISAQLGTLK